MLNSEIREKEMEYCRENVEYFIETYVKIENKDNSISQYQTFSLWDGQKRALKSIHAHKLNIILKARQLGITWLALAYATYTGLLYEGRLIICLSKTEDGAKELIRRLAFIFSYLPFVYEQDKAPKGWSGAVYKATALSLVIRFPDGSETHFNGYASSASVARGLTGDLVILDEWAFQDWADEIFKSVLPTVNRANGGKLIGLSTIARGTLFESKFVEEDNGFNKIFLPWNTDPSRDEAWYDKTYKTFGEAMMWQEYPSTIEEALTIPGGAYFPEVKPQTHCIKSKEAEFIRRYVCLDYGLDMFSAHWVAVNEKNEAWVYKEYDSPNKTIKEACDILIDMCRDEDIDSILAPPDLWNRSQESGKSRAQLFYEGGITLVKTSNDFSAGCSAIKDWLRVDEATGKPKLQIMNAPNLLNCLQKIQKDKNRPDVYAKDPHDLTHDIDSLRCFCVWWTRPAKEVRKKHRSKWTEDMLEDYRNADSRTRKMLKERYGEW